MNDVTNVFGTEIKIGDHVRILMPGVPEWKVPEQQMDVIVTEDNLGAVIIDADECVERGNARVYIVSG